MAGRQIDLEGFPKDFIIENGYEFLLDDEYIVPEAVLITSSEIEEAIKAQDKIYSIFKEELEHLIDTENFDFLNLPSQMVDLIIHSYKSKHVHLVGRFDFAGGMDGLPLKLLEYNADTPTMLPESSIIQEKYNQYYKKPFQLNTLQRDLEVVFNKLGIMDRDRHKSLLCTSLGHQEDVANAKLIMDLAGAEGFEVEYMDLPNIEFEKGRGVFVEAEDGTYGQYDYLYKLIPWEFICFDEPELLDILHNLITQDLLYVLNPAYTLAFQSKVFLDHVSNKYDLPFLLRSARSPELFRGKKYVEKVSFGRLGENISIYDEGGQVLEKTEGDFGHFEKVYQEFAQLYKDEYNEYYQLGMYNVDSRASCVSFRRGEKLIIDDDCQFVPHFEIA